MIDHSKTIALVGLPNAGKSTLFNVLCDIKSSISTANFPGTSNTISTSYINLWGETGLIVDLPGVYSLNATAKNEEVTLKYLLENKVDLIINVIDSSQLIRSLELTVELTELGIPMVLALNMIDEAESHGIDIDKEKLEQITNITAVPTVALFGKGVKALVDKASEVIRQNAGQPNTLKYTAHIEDEINSLIEELKADQSSLNGKTRFYAIKLIENPAAINFRINEVLKSKAIESEKRLSDAHKLDGFETISIERHHLSMKIAESISHYRGTRRRTLGERLDDYLLHPFGGYVFGALFLFLYFVIIFLMGDLIARISAIPIDYVGSYINPIREYNEFLWFTLNGAYMGFTGIFGIVLPYFLPLVFLTAVFEDTGYISRIAFLVDGLFHRIGLHGKSVVPFILGFGCSIPALYATRMIESERDRTITGILIPFVPCSARIAVIFALASAFTGPIWAIVVFAFVILVISLSGKTMTYFLKKPMGLILEIPSLKLPSLKISFRKTWFRTKEFFREAILFLMAGSVVLGWIEYFKIGTFVNMIFAPILKGILGLPAELGSTLVFGFLRKELIIVMASQAMGVQDLTQLPLTIDQVIVFLIFVTLYFPCFTTFVVICKEFSWKIGLYSAIFSLLIATISALIFKIILAL